MTARLLMPAIFFIFINAGSLNKAHIQQGLECKCESEEAQQFNFWVGEWKAEWKDVEGEIGTGKNIIRKILGGCVIEENFDGSPSISLIGKSFSTYNSRKDYWQQTWVDNNGSYLLFTGGMDGGEMVLVSPKIKINGEEVIRRMRFFNITEDKFDWSWEKSTDDGESWQVLWHINYTRIM